MKKEQIFSEEQKAQAFWNWFNNNQSRFLFLSHASEFERGRLMNEILSELHQFNENIYFEIDGDKDSDKFQLIISAGGYPEHFHAVEKLTSYAPEYEHWEIISFKPPRGAEYSVNYGGKVFDPRNIFFIPIIINEDANYIGFDVCYQEFDPSEKDIYSYGTYLILDGIIGEKSMALDIGHIGVIKTPENMADFNFGCLSDVGAYIEEKKLRRS